MSAWRRAIAQSCQAIATVAGLRYDMARRQKAQIPVDA
jgi:hypothetical protein